MSNEYRPRLRASRKHRVSRKGCVVIAMCKDNDDAEAIELLLKDIFTAARKAEQVEAEIATIGDRDGTPTPAES